MSCMFLTSISEAELRLGFAVMPSGRRRDGLAASFERMLRAGFANRVLPFDNAAARAYAEIASDRRAAGIRSLNSMARSWRSCVRAAGRWQRGLSGISGASARSRQSLGRRATLFRRCFTHAPGGRPPPVQAENSFWCLRLMVRGRSAALVGVGRRDGIIQCRIVAGADALGMATRAIGHKSVARATAGACVRPAEEPNGTGNPHGRNGPRRTGRAHPRACRERAGRRKAAKPAPAALPLEKPDRAVARYFFAKKAPLTLPLVNIPAASSAFGP